MRSGRSYSVANRAKNLLKGLYTFVKKGCWDAFERFCQDLFEERSLMSTLDCEVGDLNLSQTESKTFSKGCIPSLKKAVGALLKDSARICLKKEI